MDQNVNDGTYYPHRGGNSRRGFGRYNKRGRGGREHYMGNGEGPHGERRGSGHRGRGGGRGRPPKGLSGREIGMWYSRRSKQNKSEMEDKMMPSIEMNRKQMTSAHTALLNEDCGSDNEDSINLNVPENESFNKYKWFIHNSGNSDKLQREIDKTMSKPKSQMYNKLLEFRKKLPAFKMKKELLELINRNQVVVISGETGCGKTTQVPQFILDDKLEQGKGISCKIVCTQPRRISAISVAERVAKERDEECGNGNSCGYQIRLNSKLPRQRASILYCTTGILIQWLQSDCILENLSHVILDEIHERDLHSDFLLTILKNIIKKRKDLKVILMSATLNAQMFSSYFDDSPTINIPGFTFEVKQLYLEEIIPMLNYIPPVDATRAYSDLMDNRQKIRFHRKSREEKDLIKKTKQEYSSQIKEYKSELESTGVSPENCSKICAMDCYLQTYIDYNLIVQIIKHVCIKPPNKDMGNGAFLVFVPGWEDIKKVNTALSKDHFFSAGKYLIYPLHSMIPTHDQQRVFDRPPLGVTKIVIATNIAETSITIDDIVYVVDAGKIKIRNFEYSKNINVLKADWISKANMKQRKGRAGRVRDGYCFHVFSKLQERKMDDYITPEILRTPLDQLCLDVKLLKLGEIKEFLSSSLEPPPPESIDLSINKLTSLNGLDNQQNLTSLGFHLAKLPVEPQIGKMLILSSVFSCLSPVLTVAACLSFKDPFVFQLDTQKQADQCRLKFAKEHNSDHLMLINVYKQWKQAINEGWASQFCYKNFLSSHVLKMISDMREQFMKQLYDAGFVTSVNPENVDDNSNFKDIKIVQAIICAGLYPNIAKVGVTANPHRPPKMSTKTERKVSVHMKSVNASKVASQYKERWLCYYEKMKTAEIYLYDTSEIGPYPLLFFGGEIADYDEKYEHYIAVDEWITFKAKQEVATTVKLLRKELDKILASKIQNPTGLPWRKEKAQKDVLNSIISLISTT